MSKRGTNIYHRADGRWEGRYYQKGTHKYKSVYGKTYTETKEKLDKLHNLPSSPPRTCYLLVSDIMEMWIENRKSRIKESSYASYRNKLEKQILPYFKGMKYSKLDTAQIEQFISDKLESGLSEKYVSDMVIMMKSAAKWAETTHHYANLICNAELPKLKKLETKSFTEAEQQFLLKAIKEAPDLTAIGIFLTLFTGLRIGELCALQWRDIDFDRKILHISKTVQRIPIYGQKSKTAVRITAPKSETSVRDIPLPDFLLRKLSVFRNKPDNYLLSGSENFVEPRCFTNRYKALLKKAGIPSHKFHSLRHTFATNALHQNFDIKTLSELLGHASANVTLKVYIHSSMNRKIACMERMQAVL